MHKLLRTSYVVLAAVLVVCVGGFVWGQIFDVEWMAGISLNLGTEVFGILLTVLLIEAVIRKHDGLERMRIRKVAFQQLRGPLQQQLTVLQVMYKAAVSHPPEKLPTTMSELFTDDYFVQLTFLDFSMPAPLASVAPLQWFDYLHMEADKFRGALSRTIEKYATFLDATAVQLMEELINSNFLAFLLQAPAVRQLDQKENLKRRYNFFSGQGMPDMVGQHARQIATLVSMHNEVAAQDANIELDSQQWRNDIGPQFGSARTG